MAKTYYIGRQKILQEKSLENDLVEVTLEPTNQRVAGTKEVLYEPADSLGDSEVIIYHKSVLEKVKTEEENSDETTLRQLRCKEATAAVLLSLMNYCVKSDDLEYIFQSVLQTIGRASINRMRSLTGIHESNSTIQDLKEDLMK